MHRFDESRIDWDAAARHGISRRMLVEYDLLEMLLDGETTPFVPLHLIFGETHIRMDGSIRLEREADGSITFDVRGADWE